MYQPGNTYRIQFNKEFTLAALKKITGYLHQLGVSTLYASPVFSAVPGSSHGYDVTDPLSINSEVGSIEQLKEVSNGLNANGIGWLQDIVPNHMAYDTGNKWLMDVLEKGPRSPYTAYFDIDWEHPDYEGKIMLPLLDRPLDEAIKQNLLAIVQESGKTMLKYNDVFYPLRLGSFDDVSNVRQIADSQYYQLCGWQETDKTINYRRFFTINGMICLNIHDKNVFDGYHDLIKKLIENNTFQGIRVDHIDGLYDPTLYLHQLRELGGENTYITVEKILESGEALPAYWPVQGTTGYDFIALVNSLMTDSRGSGRLAELYKSIASTHQPFAQQLRAKKRIILDNYMQGELDNLYRLAIALLPEMGANQSKLKDAIASFLIYCPVYRYYSNKVPVDIHDAAAIKKIFEEIKSNEPELKEAVNALEGMFTGDDNDAQSDGAAHFFKRCMQFSGPVMAKGVEDTLMYTYNNALAHNEVGDSPAPYDSEYNTLYTFHRSIIDRQQQWPNTMNATATHDTKRGEDARARLLALPDMADEWSDAVKRWQKLNDQYKTEGAPDGNDEYFIYQALVASYPMPGQDKDDFDNRFTAYIEKALREGKRHTTWSTPNADYENGTSGFIKDILQDDSPFMQDFKTVHAKISDAGIVNSLTQLVLKCTCPGIPDIYQGCELWDLSMVDPDNRRPVNYELRMAWLEDIEKQDTQSTSELWDNRYNGKIKLWLLHELLKLRNADKELFAEGQYIPLKVTGKYKDNVIAYGRRHLERWCVIILPIHTAELSEFFDIDWMDTAVMLNDTMPVKAKNILAGEDITILNSLLISNVFGQLPFAILYGNAVVNKREAGVLLPIFSLSSAYGIGDFGSDAKKFVDFLHRGGQRYWQLLPLNPVDAGSMYSPYSSMSGMAGNMLLVSPELLAEDGLVSKDDLKKYHVPAADKIDYEVISRLKSDLLDEAYNHFCTSNFMELDFAFRQYCKQEAYWLDNHVLYMALKNEHEGQAWYQWLEMYKNRSAEAIEQFRKGREEILRKTKWTQFIIARQWQQLKRYCNNKGIKLFGDLPFYVSYDSVDVWANRGIFSLNADGAMTGIGGVPPDYFSADGQLWGVPTYDWDKIRQTEYAWWLNRLRKNAELFDVVRIDHFRAFESYWQVAAGEETARNGTWMKGPGTEFFNIVKEKLGKLPFIAEDLGYEMEEVYKLRDESSLPGMKVLQFAWGDNSSVSVDIPHNYPLSCVVYTGTHDNNTTVGWYKQETTSDNRNRINEYTGIDVGEKNVHKVMAAMAYASVAQVAILPMQDILGLDEQHRMNTPGTTVNNWQWKLRGGELTAEVEHYLNHLTKLYYRK